MKKEFKTYNQLVDIIENDKKIKLDISRDEVIEYLISEGYTRLITPNKQLLIKPKPNTKYFLKTNNQRILREFKNNIRSELHKSGDFKVKDILEHLKDYKTGIHNYEHNYTFNDLLKLHQNNKDLSENTTKKLRKIENIIKSTLAHFIGEMSPTGDWHRWLVSISSKKTRNRTYWLLNKIFDKLTKNTDKNKPIDRWKFINLPIYDVVNELTLGQLKEIMDFITYSKLDINIRKEFSVLLFGKILKRKIPSTDKYIELDELMHNMIVLVNFRNSVMHDEPLNVFLAKQQIYELNRFKIDENTRFWVKFNNLKDKSVKNLIKSHNLNLSKNFILNDLRIGYTVEVEDIKSKKIKSLDYKILKILDWWFKE